MGSRVQSQAGASSLGPCINWGNHRKPSFLTLYCLLPIYRERLILKSFIIISYHRSCYLYRLHIQKSSPFISEPPFKKGLQTLNINIKKCQRNKYNDLHCSLIGGFSKLHTVDVGVIGVAGRGGHPQLLLQCMVTVSGIFMLCSAEIWQAAGSKPDLFIVAGCSYLRRLSIPTACPVKESIYLCPGCIAGIVCAHRVLNSLIGGKICGTAPCKP